ncbi:hypothetical protein HIM_11553 [Hirsutella minnesotensis 3608]|uniref:Uncharacterized protein n=1 Tax=Hirsutella minnesotensis 3608 TaxID=1043627 RepID=A0A0F7ZWJ0_9HYPO|nr:hypothetical protein HIM_11553 [Hirsutella minnesotensis 3608]
MSLTPPAADSPPHLRRPLGTSRGAGGDMSMMFFAQPDCPARFAHQDEHRVRGLNAEAIARVLLPAPSWLLAAEYAPLRAENDDADVSSLFFSLNLSIYGQPLVDSDWSEQWFFMPGRVHPYALAWEVERRDGLEADVGDTLLYTMPALIVRDYGYQPVLPRSLVPDGQFPSTPPVVSFHGLVAGSGLDLLRADLLPGLGPDQLRCCGLVQLTTYLAPGVPDKVPFKGYYPFQVFVIFPIYVNPWLVLCKKLAERPRHDEMNGDVGVSQEVIKLLVTEDGLSFIKDVAERHVQDASRNPQSITLWENEIKPLFELITHPRVIDSAVLEQEVAAIFNYLLGIGGARMKTLIAYLASLLKAWPVKSDDRDIAKAAALELTLATLSQILNCNTTNIVNQAFSDLVGLFAACVDDMPSQAQEDFLSRA